LLLFGADEELVWEPLDLEEAATPEGVRSAVARGAYARALHLALHLGEVEGVALAKKEMTLETRCTLVRV
jgi:hypothetical protein